jgi:acetyl-CoA carboxylase biotin carboxylase subunit
MIGKLIAWGDMRREACTRIKKALEDHKIDGIKTNIPGIISLTPT